MKTVIVAMLVFGWSVASAAGPNIKKGDEAHDFTLTKVEGEGAVTLSKVLKDNKVVLLNIFNAWCGPCHGEAPDMVKIYKAYKDKGVEFISVCRNKRDTAAKAAAFAKKYGITWPVLFDQDNELTKTYRLNGVPTNCVILADGTVSFCSYMLTEEQMRAALDEALAAKPAAR